MQVKINKYKGSDNLYYFTLLNPAGGIILQSEGCRTADKRDSAIEMAKSGASIDELYERCQSIRGTWFFNLRDPNGCILGSSLMFETQDDMEVCLYMVRSLALEMLVHEGSEISGI